MRAPILRQGGGALEKLGTKAAAKARRERLARRRDRYKKNKAEAIREKRALRRSLSAKAAAHWTLRGARARRAYMERVRTALEMEGFASTPFQWRHKGHAYGLIKDLGDKQVHVRVYDDGVVDAEIEIHKRYVQHLWSPRRSAHRQVQRIFQRHGIPVHFVNERYLPQVGAGRAQYPRLRTKVSHVIAGAAGTLGAAGLYVAKLYLDRLRVRRA